MPSQASIEISSIFDDVITNNLKYCCVCLRTEEERRLVEPEHFMKCLQIMKVQIPVVTVCYVCEAESTRAYSLFQAINFASIINQWFKDMANKLKYKVEMPAYLDRHIAKQSRYVGRWPLPEWWRRVRARSDLVQTEVLVVSDATADDADRDVIELSMGPATPRPPDRPPHTDPGMDSIVIIDDDDDPLEVHAPPPPLTPAPNSIPPLASVTNPPNMIQIDQFLDSSNSISNNVILPDNNVIIPQKENVSGYILQPFLIGSDGNYHVFRLESESQVPQIHNQCQNVQVVTDNTKIFEVGPLVSEGAQNINVSGVQMLTEVAEDGQGRKGGGVEKRPVMSGRIDWEDKIPMDVISFVDATDPAIHSSQQRKRYKNAAV